jgi:hypothetical protein
MEITVTNQLSLDDVPSGLFEQIQDKLTIQNPKWLENETHGYWNGDTARARRRIFDR